MPQKTGEQRLPTDKNQGLNASYGPRAKGPYGHNSRTYQLPQVSRGSPSDTEFLSMCHNITVWQGNSLLYCPELKQNHPHKQKHTCIHSKTQQLCPVNPSKPGLIWCHTTPPPKNIYNFNQESMDRSPEINSIRAYVSREKKQN